MKVTPQVVSASEYQNLLRRIDDLDQQVGLLLATLGQIVEIMEADAMAEIEEVFGDQPDIGAAMLAVMRASSTAKN